MVSIARAARRPRSATVLVALALTVGFVFAVAPAAPATSGVNRVDPKVLQQVQNGGVATYWALLKQHADLTAATSIRDWNARGSFVYNRLTSVANSSQRGLLALLRQRGVRFTAFWIVNAIRIRSGAATLAAVAGRPEVARVVPTWSASIPPDVKSDPGPKIVEWNIQRINAPQVWSTYSDRGEGVVVANIDTGVSWTHPALFKQYRAFDTPAPTIFVNHNYNWWDPSHRCPNPSPCDNVGHGTHTMGTMVGDDGGSNQIGVAPKAHWIAAKGCESQFCSDFALMSSGQWVLAPTDLNGNNPRPQLRPDVVNNSWGKTNASDTFYQSIVQAWVAAGIFPAFAAGNEGPACSTLRSPGSYPESYTMGAFDINNNIAAFSSRGPSPFGNIIKPNIAAPGKDVRSSWNNGGYMTISGTSMATPHVAGSVALIWGTNGAPSLRGNISETESILNQTAIDVSDLTCGGSPGNNNVWGEGRLDAFAAVTKAKGLS